MTNNNGAAVLSLSSSSTISTSLHLYAAQMGFGGYVPTQAWRWDGGEALVYIDDRGRCFVALLVGRKLAVHEARGVVQALDWEGVAAVAA